MEWKSVRSITDAPLHDISGGVCLRPESDGDAEFLLRLYLSVRWHELEAVNWPDEVKHSFLAGQFRIQTQQYGTCYPGMERWIVENDSKPIGRLYVLTTETEMRMVDISLLAEWRGRGIGSALLERAGRDAASMDKPLRLHVEQHNPALRLYRRLGFQVIEEKDPYWLMECRFNASTGT